jgi:phosphatidylinositol alpha-1,6-mannosyltransferase
MRKVLLMTIDFPPRRGGVARYLDGLARYFSDEIFVIAEDESGAEEVDKDAPYEILRTNVLTNWFWPQWIKTIWLFIRHRNRYEKTIVSHVLPIGTAAWVAGWFTRRPYTVIIHGMDIGLVKGSGWKRWLAKLILQRAELVVANTDALAQEVAAVFGIDTTEVVYPCLSRIDDMAQADGEITDTQDEGFYLLSVARLVERKGVGRVLESLKYLDANEVLPDDWRYDIIGSGPLEAFLEKQINEFGLGGHVVIRNNVSDDELWRAYKQADVFVLPVVKGEVDREGFGMVYIEAAYFATPSIATDQHGVDEAVINKRTGLLVDDGDIQQLATSIETLFNDPEYTERLGKRAQVRVKNVFTCEQQLDKLKELFS